MTLTRVKCLFATKDPLCTKTQISTSSWHLSAGVIRQGWTKLCNLCYRPSLRAASDMDINNSDRQTYWSRQEGRPHWQSQMRSGNLSSWLSGHVSDCPVKAAEEAKHFNILVSILTGMTAHEADSQVKSIIPMGECQFQVPILDS